MYEPKYKLNKKDEARYRELLLRHCLEAPFSSPGVPAVPDPRYPALTRRENKEFEALHRKHRLKVESHPKVRESIERSKKSNRRAYYLLRKLKRLVDSIAPQHK